MRGEGNYHRELLIAAPGDYIPEPTKDELAGWDPYLREIYELYDRRDESPRSAYREIVDRLFARL